MLVYTGFWFVVGLLLLLFFGFVVVVGFFFLFFFLVLFFTVVNVSPVRNKNYIVTAVIGRKLPRKTSLAVVSSTQHRPQKLSDVRQVSPDRVKIGAIATTVLSGWL